MTIPYGRQDIQQADIDAVVAVLESDLLTQGPVVPSFERAIAETVDASYAVAVNSATSALHLACMALEVGPNDIVWTSPNTFVASANCARYCGATVDFVDICPRTFNLCPQQLAVKFAQAKQTGTLPKVLIVVHFAGLPCDLATIAELCTDYEVALIEDASHAIGARYKNMPIGNSQYSDITVFSFHPVKIITSAEGGVATTNNQLLAQRMQDLRSHGITRDQQRMTQDSEGDWYYQQLTLGYNYRMTELQAALGLSQLQRLASYIERRHELAKRYLSAFKDWPLSCQYQPTEYHSAYHLFVICITAANGTALRKQLFDKLRQADIGVNVHYIPVHTQPYYRALGFTPEQFPAAIQYYETAISLPLYPTLTDSQQDYVIRMIEEGLRSLELL